MDPNTPTIHLMVSGVRRNNYSGVREAKGIEMTYPAGRYLALARDMVRDRVRDRELTVEAARRDAVQIGEECLPYAASALLQCGFYPEQTLGPRWYRYSATPPVVEPVVVEVVAPVVTPVVEVPAVEVVAPVPVEPIAPPAPVAPVAPPLVRNNTRRPSKRR